MDTSRKPRAQDIIKGMARAREIRFWKYEIPMMPCTLVFLSRSTPALKVLVLRDYCELCGLSHHFYNPTHVLVTKSEEFYGAREVLGVHNRGAPFHFKNI